MRKRSNNIEYFRSEELPELLKKKIIKINTSDANFGSEINSEIKRNHELSPNKISQLDLSIKENTIYFDHEYIFNTINYELQREKLINTNINFSGHFEINDKMFGILLNWLYIVHEKFKMSPETLYLAHQVISRYLQLENNVKRKNLQLIGATALFMSSKYEDEYAPEIEDIAYICDGAYSSEDVIEMEWKILLKFDFNLLYTPTIHTFITLFSFFGNFSNRTFKCIMYLCDTSLMNSCFLQYKLSEIVASAIVISCAFTNYNSLNFLSEDITLYSYYKKEDLKNCIATFCNFFSEKSNLTEKNNNVYKKYLTVKMDKISASFKNFDWNLATEN